MIEQLKRFQFFNQENIQDKQPGFDQTKPLLNDIDISQGLYIEPKLYFASKRTGNIYIHENDSLLTSFKPYNETLTQIEKNTSFKDGFLLTFGIDNDSGIKSSLIKIWDVETTESLAKPRKTILLGKLNSPITNLSCFAVNQELTFIACGLLDGTIILFRAEGKVDKKNFLLGEAVENKLQLEKVAICCLYFTREENTTHLFYSTKSGLFCLQGLSNKKTLNTPGSNVCDLSEKGSLFCLEGESQSISEFSSLTKLNSYSFESEKIDVKCFGQNYLIVAALVRQEHATTSFTIYDIVNNYVAFSSTFTSIQHIIKSHKFIFIITLNQRGEKALLKLSEKDNNLKLETFFKRSFFDVAYRFAQNQNSDPSLLAEISRLHGDHLYAKGDFANAIKQYALTTGHIEPSYIIRRFLDVAHIEFLIIYLEEIHDKKLADKHHTALLLNCYVKQKSIGKLENFLKKSNFDSELFDTETAIKVCRELSYEELALKLAQQSNHIDLYLKILIEDKKDYKHALQFIRGGGVAGSGNLTLDEKIKFLKEFGQILMKNEPNITLEFIIKLVSLSTIKFSKNQGGPKVPNAEEKEILAFLNLNPTDWENLPSVNFPKPDEYLHLFVVNNQHLEQFLCFLKAVKKLPNEKVIFHRLFEYYLEDYTEYYNKIIPTLKYRQTQDLDLLKKEKSIMELLKEPEYERKYDKNHLLILFKMYNFDQGIVYLCEKMQLKEELLHFYMDKKDFNKIIEVCGKFGDAEPNLWIQALKYFTKTEKKIEKIEEILDNIKKQDTLSPLLILNILKKSNNIPLKLIKKYFSNKIETDKNSINKDLKTINFNMEKIYEAKMEYKKLKTQAKIFQAMRCAMCEKQLTLPSVHFMCGHSFDENCIPLDRSEQECLKCMHENKRVLDTKEQFDFQISDNKFFEKLSESKNKFDVIGEYFGRNLFKKEKKFSLD